MSYQDVIYDEEIDSNTAAQLLGMDPFEGDVRCKMITTMNSITIMIHDNITGKEREYTLDNLPHVPENSIPLEHFSENKETNKKTRISLDKAATVILVTCGLLSVAMLLALKFYL